MGQDGRVVEHADRPWGTYTVLLEAEDFKVKTIEVHPGQRLSYQRHSRRSEHWFVVGGAGVVTVDGTSVQVRRGDAVDVALGAAHRIQNTGNVPLVFVEVQHGDYFGEDDIVRLDDDYGRSALERPAEEPPVLSDKG
jgi:mannose-6-phosphate isomerase